MVGGGKAFIDLFSAMKADVVILRFEDEKKSEKRKMPLPKDPPMGATICFGLSENKSLVSFERNLSTTFSPTYMG